MTDLPTRHVSLPKYDKIDRKMWVFGPTSTPRVFIKLNSNDLVITYFLMTIDDLHRFGYDVCCTAIKRLY